MPATHDFVTTEKSGTWSVLEHERFLQAMVQYPTGPWKLITEYVGTRSIKQVQTHAQKYQQKLLRHQRGLRKAKTKGVYMEHRVDESTVKQFTTGCIVRKAAATSAASPTASTTSTASRDLPVSLSAPASPAELSPTSSSTFETSTPWMSQFVEVSPSYGYAPSRTTPSFWTHNVPREILYQGTSCQAFEPLPLASQANAWGDYELRNTLNELFA